MCFLTDSQTHVNPCFVQSSITDEPRPLTRNSWCPLQDGDLFSLLPGHLIYKVVSVGGVTGTRRYIHHVRIKKRLKSLSNKSWCQRKTERLLFNSGLTFYLCEEAAASVDLIKNPPEEDVVLIYCLFEI